MTIDVAYDIFVNTISQADSAGVVKHLLYDGHGSTRQLLEHVLVDNGPGSLRPDIDETFDFDGYGVMLGGNPSRGDSPATSLLYSGESFDSDSQHYYLRARYYNPSNGRFNQTDPYAGNMSDPQSLHKYLYCHANPVNGVDLSGEMTIVSQLAVVTIQSIVGGIMAGSIAKAHLKAKSQLSGYDSIVDFVLDKYLYRVLDWAFFGTRQTFNIAIPSPYPGFQFTISAGIEVDPYHAFKTETNSLRGAMIRIYASGGIHLFGTVPPGITPRLKNWKRPVSLPILANKWKTPGSALRVPFRHGLQGTELGKYLTGEIGVVGSIGKSSLSLGAKYIWKISDGTTRWEAGFGVGQGSGIAVEIGMVLKLPY